MNFKLNEFTFMDATEQAELVKHKQVKPIELVEAAIRRIESVNPSLNAVILTMYDQARDICLLYTSPSPRARG